MTVTRHRAKNHQPRTTLAPPGLEEFSRILSTALSPDSVHDARQPAAALPRCWKPETS